MPTSSNKVKEYCACCGKELITEHEKEKGICWECEDDADWAEDQEIINEGEKDE